MTKDWFLTCNQSIMNIFLFLLLPFRYRQQQQQQQTPTLQLNSCTFAATYVMVFFCFFFCITHICILFIQRLIARGVHLN